MRSASRKFWVVSLVSSGRLMRVWDSSRWFSMWQSEVAINGLLCLWASCSAFLFGLVNFV